MSSKFFELVALRKPILYFGEKGEVSDYIVKHRLGYHINLENITTIINNIYNNLTTQQIPDRNYDVSSHTFNYQTKLLIETLEEL
jgi:type III secretion system FlhB-like substrate exporter